MTHEKIIHNNIAYPVYYDIKLLVDYKECITPNLASNLKGVKEPIVFTGTGSSGIVLASILSMELLEKYKIESHVKYITKESRHTVDYIFYDNPVFLIVVDDFVGTGNTMFHIHTHLFERDQIEYVKGLVVSSWSKDTAKKYFPNLKFYLQPCV